MRSSVRSETWVEFLRGRKMKLNALTARNGEFYDAFWSKTYLTRPESFNTWPMISALLAGASERLEVGPGLRPRLPIVGTHFVDISLPVIAQLNAAGGLAREGEITALPHGDVKFDLVTAFDVIEHVEDDGLVFSELIRVLKYGGHLVFSVPLHSRHWNTFDDYVGHARRYEPATLRDLLTKHGLAVEQSVPFGMQSNNPRLLSYAVQGLKRHHSIAVRCYNWLFFPLGLLLQRRLKFIDGLMDLDGVHEVLLVCRKTKRATEVAT
jgi:SAM-dependent methyltransferase